MNYASLLTHFINTVIKPSSLTKERTNCCFCCYGNSVYMRFWVPKLSYCELNATRDWARLIRVYTLGLNVSSLTELGYLADKLWSPAAHLSAPALFTTDTPHCAHKHCTVSVATDTPLASYPVFVWALTLSVPRTHNQFLHLSHCLSVDSGCDVPSVGCSAPHTQPRGRMHVDLWTYHIDQAWL